MLVTVIVVVVLCIGQVCLSSKTHTHTHTKYIHMNAQVGSIRKRTQKSGYFFFIFLLDQVLALVPLLYVIYVIYVSAQGIILDQSTTVFDNFTLDLEFKLDFNIRYNNYSSLKINCCCCRRCRAT